MPSVILTRGQDGKLEGHGWADKRAYKRFKKRLALLEPDDTLEFTWRTARCPAYHRAHFAMLRAVFDNQETFEGDYEFRKWGEMGAGHCSWVPGPDKVMVPIPKSIDYMTLDDEEFRELNTAVKNFLRSPRGLATLWPHVKMDVAWETLDVLLEGGR